MSGALAPRLLGGLLWLAALILIGVGERAQLDDRQDQVDSVGAVLELKPGQPAATLEGRLVRVSGLPQVLAPPRDDEFGQAAPAAAALTRRVEMFQWREVHLGADLHYELDWVDHPLDSTHFAQPGGHANPGAFPIQGRRFEAGELRLGGLALAPSLLRALPGTAPLAARAAALPTNLAASFSSAGDDLSSSANPRAPRLGDLRLSWTIVPIQPVTVLARVEQGRLTPNSGVAADAVQVGDRSLRELLPGTALPPRGGGGWRRALALLLGALGASLALRGALLGRIALGLLVVAVLAAVLWLGHGWLPLLGWLALAVPCLLALLWQRRQPPPAASR